MATAVHDRLTSGEGRRFGLTVGSAFLVFATVALSRVRPTAAALLGSIGLVLAIAGILIPTRLAPVEREWMALARPISFVTTPIVIAVMYFGIITPVGLLRRLVADNPIVQRATSNGYWKTRAKGRSSNMERQF